MHVPPSPSRENPICPVRENGMSMSHMNCPKPNTEIKGKSSHVGKRLQVFKTMGCGFSYCEEQSQYALVRGCGGVDWLGAHDERERVRPWTAICRAWLGVLATQLLDTCAQISWERCLVCWGRWRTFAKLTLGRSYFTKAQRVEIISLLQVLALFCHKHDINKCALACSSPRLHVAFATEGLSIGEGKMIYLHYRLSTHAFCNHEDISPHSFPRRIAELGGLSVGIWPGSIWWQKEFLSTDITFQQGMKKRFTFLLGLSFALYIQSPSIIKSTCPTPCQLCQWNTAWEKAWEQPSGQISERSWV